MKKGFLGTRQAALWIVRGYYQKNVSMDVGRVVLETFASFDDAALGRAIYLSCVDGRTFTWERLDVPYSRSDFYKRRAATLDGIALKLGLSHAKLG